MAQGSRLFAKNESGRRIEAPIKAEENVTWLVVLFMRENAKPGLDMENPN